MIEFHEIKTVVVGLDSEAELPEVIHEWTQCIEGDILEPTPVEMALACCAANSDSMEEMEDNLAHLIGQLQMAMANTVNKQKGTL